MKKLIKKLMNLIYDIIEVIRFYFGKQKKHVITEIKKKPVIKKLPKSSQKRKYKGKK